MEKLTPESKSPCQVCIPWKVSLFFVELFFRPISGICPAGNALPIDNRKNAYVKSCFICTRANFDLTSVFFNCGMPCDINLWYFSCVNLYVYIYIYYSLSVIIIRTSPDYLADRQSLRLAHTSGAHSS